jgi:1-acyl-sn-glycerol-3-phosphate acyltransferase
MKPLALLLHAIYGLYAWLVASVLLTTGWLLSISLPGLHLRRRTASLTIFSIAWFIRLPIRLHGQEHLPEGASIVVANHISYMDGPMMLAVLPPRYSFVVKGGAEHAPVVGTLLRRMGCTFVSRDNAMQGSADTRRLMRALREGQALGFFPEGRIQRKPGLQPFRLGAFLMAARCGTPIVPAAISGTRKFLPRNYWWPSRSVITIQLLPAIAPDGNDRQAAIRLRDKAYAAVLAHCEEPAAVPDKQAPSQAAEIPKASHH